MITSDQTATFIGLYIFIGFITALYYTYKLIRTEERWYDHIVYVLCGPSMWIIYILRAILWALALVFGEL